MRFSATGFCEMFVLFVSVVSVEMRGVPCTMSLFGHSRALPVNPIAHAVERLIRNQQVGGSTPPVGSSLFNRLGQRTLGPSPSK